MGFSLASFFNPKIGLKMLKVEIERRARDMQKELDYFGVTRDKFQIVDYDIIYNAMEQKIDFKVYMNGKEREYLFEDSKKICDIIAGMLKEKVTTGDITDIAVINYRENGDNICNVYYRNKEGQKLQSEFKI